jgi:hypothetical protein
LVRTPAVFGSASFWREHLLSSLAVVALGPPRLADRARPDIARLG